MKGIIIGVLMSVPFWAIIAAIAITIAVTAR